MKIIYSGNQNGLVERKIKPLKLCFKDQAWYLYAYCCLREDYRFFKLRRISQITVLDTCFEPEMVGKVLCLIEVTDIHWFVSYVLSYGSNMRVLEPLEVKERVMQEIEKMKYLYKTGV